MKKSGAAIQSAVKFGALVGTRMFTALSILMEVQKIKFESPSAGEKALLFFSFLVFWPLTQHSGASR